MRTRRLNRGWLASRMSPVPGDVLAALHELGIDVLRVVGDEATARCYMHVERTGKDDAHPSWSCNIETGTFNCFSCGWKGGFAQIVVDVLGIPWDDAVEWVRKRGGIERVNKILGRGQYVDDLVPHRESPTYTEADLALYTAPPQQALQERGLTRSSCEAYGVLWDPARSMWITPIRNSEGTLLGWQEKNERYFRNRPYTVEKSKALFGYHILRPGSVAILLESPLDCARMDSVGVEGAVSSYGAGVSDAQMQLLFERVSRIILALDNDPDGWKYSLEIRDRYRGMGRRLAFYNYLATDVKDPGEQSGDEIRRGVEEALSPLKVRYPESVRRRTQALSGRGRRPDGGAGLSPAGVRPGNRENRRLPRRR